MSYSLKNSYVMIFHLASTSAGQLDPVFNLSLLGDPFPYSMRSHKNPGRYVSRKPRGVGGHFYMMLISFMASSSATRCCRWGLVLPSVSRPCSSGRLRDPSSNGPSLLRTAVPQASSTEVPACWGTPVSAPSPCPTSASEEYNSLPSVWSPLPP